MSRVDDLERLARLLDEGKLTPEEYEQAKQALLSQPEEPEATPGRQTTEPRKQVTRSELSAKRTPAEVFFCAA